MVLCAVRYKESDALCVALCVFLGVNTHCWWVSVFFVSPVLRYSTPAGWQAAVAKAMDMLPEYESGYNGYGPYFIAGSS